MMGIKENFTNAVKELAGFGDKKADNPPVVPNESDVRPEAPPIAAAAPLPVNTVDELKRSVYDDGAGFGSEREISLETDEDMTATVRPMPRTAAQDTYPGGSPPVSLFGAPPPPAPAPAPAPTPEAAPFGIFGADAPPPAPETPPPAASFSAPEPTPEPAPPPSAVAVPPAFASPPPFAPPPAAAVPPAFQSPPPFAQSSNAFSSPPPPPPRAMSAMPVTAAPRSGDSDNELTVISRNTMVDGNIRSFADMSIDGDIKGDVETTKNIDLNGKIIGNIACNNAMMHTSQVQGNIRMKGNVSMKRDTLLIGDLMSTYAEVNGKVKGNLDVVGQADLRGDAVVFGDISASTITVENGAIIQGYVSTTFLNKEESRNLFPDTVIIDETAARY